MKVPSHINCDHLMSPDESLRIAFTVPSTKDRALLVSHTVVCNAIVKEVEKVVAKERDEIATWLEAQGGPYKVVANHIRAGETPSLAALPAPSVVASSPKPWGVRRVNGSIDYFDTRKAARSAKGAGEVVLRCG